MSCTFGKETALDQPWQIQADDESVQPLRADSQSVLIMRGIVNSTEDFEAWERKQTDLSDKLLAKKHGKMADGAFPFLRATRNAR